MADSVLSAIRFAIREKIGAAAPPLWPQEQQQIRNAANQGRNALQNTLMRVQGKYKTRIPANLQRNAKFVNVGLNAFNEETADNATTITNNEPIVNGENYSENNNNNLYVEPSNEAYVKPTIGARRSTLSSFLPQPTTLPQPKTTTWRRSRGGRRKSRRLRRRN